LIGEDLVSNIQSNELEGKKGNGVVMDKKRTTLL
jgi:hypothetical protein